METREQRRQILNSAVEQFLDHLEEDFDENSDFGECEVGAVIICGELHTTVNDRGTVIPTFYSSNENGIWTRGMFELLTDYKRLPATTEDD